MVKVKESIDPSEKSYLLDQTKESLKPSSLDQMINTLPRFLMLYKPFQQTASLGLGALRTVFSLNELKNLHQQDQPIPPSAVLNTLVETASLAATIFLHPVGMLITTVKDLTTDVGSLKTHLDAGNYTEAMESGAKVLSSALYLSVFAVGGVQLSIASLALQIGLGIYSAKKAYSQGSYIEAAGHLAMALILGKQMSSLASQLMPIQEEKNQAEAPSKKEPEKAKTIDEPKAPSKKEPEKTQTIDKPKPTHAEYTLNEGMAQYKNSDYSNAVRVERGISLDEAKRIASSDSEIAYFFRVKGGGMALETNRNTSYDPLNLVTRGEYRHNSEVLNRWSMRYFANGDTVFFKDTNKMWLGTAPGMADTYIKNS